MYCNRAHISQFNEHDLRITAAMALRLRQSTFMTDYLGERQREDEGLMAALAQIVPEEGKNDE